MEKGFDGFKDQSDKVEAELRTKNAFPAILHQSIASIKKAAQGIQAAPLLIVNTTVNPMAPRSPGRYGFVYLEETQNLEERGQVVRYEVIGRKDGQKWWYLGSYEVRPLKVFTKKEWNAVDNSVSISFSPSRAHLMSLHLSFYLFLFVLSKVLIKWARFFATTGTHTTLAFRVAATCKFGFRREYSHRDLESMKTNGKLRSATADQIMAAWAKGQAVR